MSKWGQQKCKLTDVLNGFIAKFRNFILLRQSVKGEFKLNIFSRAMVKLHHEKIT